MWDTFSLPWQAALEMAWDAYCADTVPIGAVIADAEGNIIARGRNRIKDQTAPEKQVYANELAHAELNALLELKLDQDECEERGVALYTTVEPCPLCMGALYMSDVKTLHFASRDPWAGSTNLLGTTPYLSRKPFRVVEPFSPALEIAVNAMGLESMLQRYGEERIISSNLIKSFREVLPDGVELGIALYHSNELIKLKEKNASTKEAFEYLLYQVK